MIQRFILYSINIFLFLHITGLSEVFRSQLWLFFSRHPYEDLFLMYVVMYDHNHRGNLGVCTEMTFQIRFICISVGYTGVSGTGVILADLSELVVSWTGQKRELMFKTFERWHKTIQKLPTVSFTTHNVHYIGKFLLLFEFTDKLFPEVGLLYTHFNTRHVVLSVLQAPLSGERLLH